MMHRLNLTIDESLYEQARLHSFVSKKSISQIFREGLSLYLTEENENSAIKKEMESLQNILKTFKENGLNIEPIEQGSVDDLAMQAVREDGAKTYTIEEVKAQLDL